MFSELGKWDLSTDFKYNFNPNTDDRIRIRDTDLNSDLDYIECKKEDTETVLNSIDKTLNNNNYSGVDVYVNGEVKANYNCDD